MPLRAGGAASRSGAVAGVWRRCSLKSGVAAAVLLGMVLSWRPLLADEVRLRNGDRLSGDVVRVEDGILLLRTFYAGELKIDQKEIVCISAQKENTVVLKGNQILTGKLGCPGDGTVSVTGKQLETIAPVELSALSAVNPSPATPPVKYTGAVTLGASRSSGNTNTMNTNFSGKFSAQSKRQRFRLGAKYNYGRTDGVEDQRNALGTVKYDFFVDKKLYSYANTLFENDRFQDLQLRSTFSLGLGYQICGTGRTKLSVEVGPAYFDKDYYVAEDDSGGAGRWSAELDYDFVPKCVRFFHQHEGYYYYTDGGAYYVRSEQGFRLPLIDQLFANLELDYDFDSSPASGKERADETYIFGLGYEHDF